MRKLFKILAPMAFIPSMLTPLSLTSCGMHSRVKHLTPYLHEITYDDYIYDENEETTKEAEAFGCSSVRNGNFYGRNFDYVFNDTPEFIVRVKANKEKNRHASIGVATHFGLRENKLLRNEYDRQLDLIPNLTLDGINDCGLVCSHNVVSMEAKTSDDMVPETHPNAPRRLHQLFVPRYVLDNASNVDEAVALLKAEDLNIQGNLNNDHFLHVMIAGKDKDGNDKTVVVEFMPNNTTKHFDVIYEEKDGTDNKEQIMTNYYCNNLNDRFFKNQQKNGEERFAILKNGYASSDSFEGMQKLMQKVIFSKAYNYQHNPVPMKIEEEEKKGDLTSEWYSEFVPQSTLYPTEGPAFDYEKYLVGMVLFKQDYWNARILDYRVPSNPNFWQTTHNSTYDMEHKHLRVVVQEQYETYFDYYL